MTLLKSTVPALMLSLLLAVPVDSREAVPELVERAADLYARDVAGAILCRTKLESRIKSPVFNRHTVMDSWVVMKDGLPVRTRIVTWRNDGKESSRKEIAEQEAKTNAAYREGKAHFQPPYDRRYMAAYDFQIDASEAEGPNALKTVRFTSTRQDEQHGSGMFTLDRDDRIHRVVFKPNVFPKNVDRGSFTLVRGEVAPGLFGLRRLEMRYEGSMGFIKGGFDLEQDYEGYRRFKSLEEALAMAFRP